MHAAAVRGPFRRTVEDVFGKAVDPSFYEVNAAMLLGDGPRHAHGPEVAHGQVVLLARHVLHLHDRLVHVEPVLPVRAAAVHLDHRAGLG